MPDAVDQYFAQQGAAPAGGDAVDKYFADQGASTNPDKMADEYAKSLNPKQQAGVNSFLSKSNGAPLEAQTLARQMAPGLYAPAQTEEANYQRGLAAHPIVGGALDAANQFTRGALSHSTATAAGLEDAGRLAAHAAGWQGGEQALANAAANTRAYQPSATTTTGKVAGALGNAVGGLPALAGPGRFMDATNTALQSYDEAEKNGVTGFDEVKQIAGTTAVNALTNRIFAGQSGAGQAGERALQNMLAPQINKFVEENAAKYIAKYGAKAGIGVLANEAATVTHNALNGRPMTEGMIDPAQIVGAVLPMAMEGVKDLHSGGDPNIQGTSQQAIMERQSANLLKPATVTEPSSNPVDHRALAQQALNDQTVAAPPQPANLIAPPEAQMNPLQKARMRAQQDLVEGPKFQPVPASEGPTKPGEIGTGTRPESKSNALVELKAKQASRPEANPEVQQHAADYAKQAGLEYNPDTSYAKVDEGRAAKIAADYDAMQHAPNDPKVKASYDAFKKETLDQYNYLKNQGVKFEWTDQNPYPDSKAMAKDIADNKTLKVYTGGDMSPDHPLAEKAEGDRTYNDVFRAVHDYFGHAKEGYGFGPRGEENAWRQHSQMYSPEARGAMTAETRGQNSWVNFGPHGEANRADPTKTVYAEQKAGLLPDEHTQLEAPKKSPDRMRPSGHVILPKAEDLVGPGTIYHEEVKPALDKIGPVLANAKEALKSVFPVESGGGHEETQGIFRARLSEQKNNQQRTQVAMKDATDAFDRMGKDANHEFMQRMYDKQDQPTPELQKIADAMYDDTNEGRKMLVKAGKAAAAGWDEEKWNMLWKKDPDAAAALNQKINRPGKLGGAANFLKKQTLSDWQEGINKGLVPKFDNAMDMFLATKAERGRYLAGLNAANDMAKANIAQRQLIHQAVPDGWRELPPAAMKLFRDALQAEPGVHRVIVPEGAARIIDNITKPSALQNGFTGDVYGALRALNNTMTQSLLGISGLHIKKIAQETINLNVARAMSEGVQGNLPGIKSLLGASNPFNNVARGAEIQDTMLNLRKAASPEMQRTIDYMIKGGFTALADQEYQTSWGRKVKQALNDGGVQGLIRAGIKAPLALNEKLMQDGVFGYVQHTKLALGADQLSDFMKRNPNATDAEITKESGRISDHMDNVLGLMNRDNLFWNRTARDLATLSTLSVGWNYGSARALGGGLMDVGRNLGTLVKGGDVSKADMRRIAYIASTSALTALTGAVATYLMTGKPPQKLQDYVHPDTGKKDAHGNAVRLDTGFYTDDWYGFLNHPLDSATSKASPLVHAVGGILRNDDNGTRIVQKDDDMYHAAGAIAEYLGKTSMPISLSNLQQTISGGKSTFADKALPFLGVKRAPQSFSQTPAERLAYNLMDQHINTREQADKEQQINRLSNEFRQQDPDRIKDLQSSTLSLKDRQQVIKRAQEPQGLPGLIKNPSLDVTDLMHIWSKADASERRQIQWAIKKRIVGADTDDTLTTAVKRQYLNQIREDVARDSQ